jgi:hypothetical protein
MLDMVRYPFYFADAKTAPFYGLGPTFDRGAWVYLVHVSRFSNPTNEARRGPCIRNARPARRTYPLYSYRVLNWLNFYQSVAKQDRLKNVKYRYFSFLAIN